MKPKVSVILLSYNHAKYVGQAIESVLNQSYSDFELLIGDDCSQDNSVEVINTYKDKRIRLLVREKNLGAVFNHLDLLNQTNGEYIALLNSDDYWYPEKLERQVALMNSNREIAMCSCWADFIDEDGDAIEIPDYANVFVQHDKIQSGWIKHFFMHGNCVCHPGVLMRKEYYVRLNAYNPALRQLPDFDLWVRLSKNATISIIEKKLVAHRRFIANGENTSAPKLENSVRDVFESYIILKHFFDGLSDELFIDAFQTEFINKNARTPVELTCEKFYLLLNGKYYLSDLGKKYAPEFLIENYTEEVAKEFEKTYNFTLKDVYFWTKEWDILNLKKLRNDQKQEDENGELAAIKNIKSHSLAKKILGKNTKVYQVIKRLYKKMI